MNITGNNIDQAQHHLQQAQAALAAQDNQGAVYHLSRLLNYVPNDPEVNELLGLQMCVSHQREQGIKYLEKAVEIDPNRPRALIELAQVYGASLRRFDKAVPYIQRAEKVAPNNPSVYAIKGTIHQNQAQLPQAVDSFRKALELRLELPTKLAQKQQDNRFEDPRIEQLMWDTLHLLAAHKVHAFPMAGVLLGLVREGGLLPFDDDLDFGLPFKEIPKARRVLEQHGWIYTTLGRCLSNPISLIHRQTGVQVDLFGFTTSKDNKHSYTGMWIKDIPKEWNRYEQFPKLELVKSKDPQGRLIWSLKDPQLWVEAEYGPDWRTPDPHFDTTVCSYGNVGFPLMVQCYCFIRLLMHWNGGQLEKALRLAEYANEQLAGDNLLKRVIQAIKKGLVEA